jgi:hypothetical protein
MKHPPARFSARDLPPILAGDYRREHWRTIKDFLTFGATGVAILFILTIVGGFL